MSQAPVLYQFDLVLNHIDRGLNETPSIRTARHSSETIQRVWLRVLAYCWHWQERLTFGPGLSDPEAPDLLAQDLTGQTTAWIRVGKAVPAKIQRMADQNPHAKVAVFFESKGRMATFCEEARTLTRLGSVELVAVDEPLLEALSANDQRRNKASVTIVGDHFYIERDGASFDGACERGSVVAL